eukprot:403344146
MSRLLQKRAQKSQDFFQNTNEAILVKIKYDFRESKYSQCQSLLGALQFDSDYLIISVNILQGIKIVTENIQNMKGDNSFLLNELQGGDSQFYEIDICNSRVQFAEASSIRNNQIRIYQATIYTLDKQDKITLKFQDQKDYMLFKNQIYGQGIIVGVELYDEYTFIKRLGKGTQAEVSLFKNKQNGKLYAIKQQRIQTIEDYMQLQREIKNLRSLQSCPGVIRLKRVYQQGDIYNLILNYLEYGSLSDYIIHKQNKLDESVIISICKQLLKVLKHMQSLKIIHRDIKPENILIKNNTKELFTVCLTDFGLAISTQDYKNGKIKCGTPGFIDPDVLNGKGFSTKSDIFGLGSVIFSLLTLRPLFEGSKVDNILFNNQHMNTEYVLKKEKSKISSSLYDLLYHMLLPNSNNRPQADKFLHQSREYDRQVLLQSDDKARHISQENIALKVKPVKENSANISEITAAQIQTKFKQQQQYKKFDKSRSQPYSSDLKYQLNQSYPRILVTRVTQISEKKQKFIYQENQTEQTIRQI